MSHQYPVEASTSVNTALRNSTSMVEARHRLHSSDRRYSPIGRISRLGGSNGLLGMFEIHPSHRGSLMGLLVSVLRRPTRDGRDRATLFSWSRYEGRDSLLPLLGRFHPEGRSGAVLARGKSGSIRPFVDLRVPTSLPSPWLSIKSKPTCRNMPTPMSALSWMEWNVGRSGKTPCPPTLHPLNEASRMCARWSSGDSGSWRPNRPGDDLITTPPVFPRSVTSK